MSALRTVRNVLLASVFAAAGTSVALAQAQTPGQPSGQPAAADTMQNSQPQQRSLENGTQAQAPAGSGEMQSNPQEAMPAQYNSQDQTQAQPLGTANAGEGMQGLPVDQVVNVQGTQVACSGIGKGDETNPQFAGLPVRFSLVGGYGQWLGDETLTVSSQNGGHSINVKCSGPWVLMRLNPGRYSVTADVPDAGTKTISFSVPSSGAREVTIRFPQATRGESNYHATQSATTTM